MKYRNNPVRVQYCIDFSMLKVGMKPNANKETCLPVIYLTRDRIILEDAFDRHTNGQSIDMVNATVNFKVS